MIVTFLYRIRNQPDRFYGKYIGRSPVYEEGLDRALSSILLPVFQQVYPSVVEETDVFIGILSADRDGKDYYSEEEKSVFDLLYCQWPAAPVEVFFHGTPVTTK